MSQFNKFPSLPRANGAPRKAAFGAPQQTRRTHQKGAMKTYHVKFSYDGEGEPQVRSYKAANPGQAFNKCVREFPGAKLLEGWNEGGRGSEYGCVTYPPSSTARIVAEPAPKTEETTFPFYDDCLGTRHSGGATRNPKFLRIRG